MGSTMMSVFFFFPSRLFSLLYLVFFFDFFDFSNLTIDTNNVITWRGLVEEYFVEYIGDRLMECQLVVVLCSRVFPIIYYYEISKATITKLRNQEYAHYNHLIWLLDNKIITKIVTILHDWLNPSIIILFRFQPYNVQKGDL